MKRLKGKEEVKGGYRGIPFMFSFFGLSENTLILLLLLFAIAIFFLFLLLIYLHRRSSPSDKTEPNKKEHVPSTPPQKSNVSKKKRGNSYSRIIETLREEYPRADEIGLKKVKIKGDRLVGIFFIELDETLLKYRDIKYRFLSKREIDHEESMGKEEDLSKLINRKDPRFFVDEYKSVYLGISDSIKRIHLGQIERKDIISDIKKWISLNREVETNRLIIKNIFNDGGMFTVLLVEKDAELEHYVVAEENGGMIEYNVTCGQSSYHEEKDLSELTELPFTHGIEIELQVVRENWRWVGGDQMTIVFEEILNEARGRISRLRNEADDLIRKKWTEEPVIKEDSKGYEAVHIEYGSENRSYSLLGKDSHVALKTNILEIQTPPCEYLEELEWWIYNLYRISHEVVEGLDIGATVLSIGTNPVEEYSKGVSFGEHHHLGIEDEDLRKEVYNTFRYFTPHLIGISSDSPFLASMEPRFTSNEMGNFVILSPSYSMRLEKNNEQFRTSPYLPISKGKDHLKKKLKRTGESLRMIDIYPYTRFGTIEVRLFDTQLTTMDRISLAIILQVLALYVKGEVGKGHHSPRLSTERLKRNRENSIEDGMMGRLHIPKEGDLPLIEKKNEKYIYESWKNTLERLWPYFEELGLESSPYLKNILLKLYCSDVIPIHPPISPSQLILYREYQEGEDFEALLHGLRYISTKAATDKRYSLWSDYVDLEDVKISDLGVLSSEEVSP
ncbi:MAG: hypothetical protein KGY76_06925 [Candidatus Thermoplasmatota archaeon]|nr:hypothetical protein [Candidatus Thermoplasmatota archaeon]